MPFALAAAAEPQSFIATEESEVSFLAANDPVFSDLKPDDFKAYVRFRVATAFPALIGPEMHGRVFGFHPQVLVNSFRTLLHQQTNLGHLLKAYGAYRDRIIGNVVGVSVANLQRQTKQTMAATADAAQYLDVVAVIYKAAEGVKELLGNHTSARQKQSVSIEVGTTMGDLEVYDPRDGSILALSAATELYPKLLSVHKEKGIQIGKVDGVQFAFAAGGASGSVPFRGVGYTPSPAEKKTAKIIDLKASMFEDVCFAAMALPEWEPGGSVRWAPVLYGQDAGCGTVVEVIMAGSVTRHGMTKLATPADPLLDIKVRGKNLHVIRHAGSVSKNN
jgi:hypothetical protein